MTPPDIEAEALKLPASQRQKLAQRLLASLVAEAPDADEDPILGLGRAPVDCGTADGSVEHDRYIYGLAAQ